MGQEWAGNLWHGWLLWDPDGGRQRDAGNHDVLVSSAAALRSDDLGEICLLSLRMPRLADLSSRRVLPPHFSANRWDSRLHSEALASVAV